MPPRLARLLAVVAAVALVAGAFAVRSALADDDDGGTVTAGPGGDGDDGRDDGDGDDGDGGATGTYRVACDEDLGAACEALAGTGDVEVEVVTWDEVRIAATEAGAPPFDAWLTLDPLPAIVDQARVVDGRPPLSGDHLAVASSPLALLTREDGPACTDWACVIDTAATDDVGVPSLGTSAGLVVVAGAFAAIGDDVEGRGIAALDSDVEGRLRDLTAELDLADQSSRFVTQIGRYDGIVTTAGIAERRISSRPAERLARQPLDPEVVVGVVLTGIGERGNAAVGDLRQAVREQTVRDALASAGWTGDPAPGAGLPDPDVIYALWEELGS